jgi:tetratricopeptide (TPR) repeat protein
LQPRLELAGKNMNSDTILILNDIKIALYILIAVVTLGVVANWVRAGVSIKSIIRRQLDDIFTEDASDYYDKGKFDELLEHCEAQLKDKPNHSYALWYKAKAYYQKQEYEKSKQCFDRLSKDEPSWIESHIQPYLKKIEAVESEKR